MTFAAEIVEDAAAFVMADEGDIGLEPDEFALGTRILNDFCAELFELGVDLGYRPVSSSGDPVTVPSGANMGLKQNLGIRMAPMLGLILDADTKEQARESLRRLKAIYMRKPKVRVPPTLPTGAGNNLGRQYTDYRFYPFTLPVARLRLASSSTVTISAIDTPVIIAGWTVDSEVNVTALPAGTVEYLNNEAYLAKLEASLTVNAASNDQFTAYFRKNDAILEQSAMVFDADASQNILMRAAETLRRNDTVSLVVENNQDTNDLTVTHGHFMVS